MINSSFEGCTSDVNKPTLPDDPCNCECCVSFKPVCLQGLQYHILNTETRHLTKTQGDLQLRLHATSSNSSKCNCPWGKGTTVHISKSFFSRLKSKHRHLVWRPQLWWQLDSASTSSVSVSTWSQSHTSCKIYLIFLDAVAWKCLSKLVSEGVLLEMFFFDSVIF